MLVMYSLSVNVFVCDIFAYNAEALLIVLSERKSEVVTRYVGIKSENLRNILRDLLHDIEAVSLMEGKPSVSERDSISKKNADSSSCPARCAASFSFNARA